MLNLNFLQTQFQIGAFEFSLVPDYSSLDLIKALSDATKLLQKYINRINLAILTSSNTLPNNCFNSIIYVVQRFHKLEINIFSSSSFSCTFMWGNIWPLIWTFLWKSTNLRCCNCLLAVSFAFTKIYFNITVSVLTPHCRVQKTK